MIERINLGREWDSATEERELQSMIERTGNPRTRARLLL